MVCVGARAVVQVFFTSLHFIRIVESCSCCGSRFVLASRISFNHSYYQRAMVWNVGSDELRQMADSDPSLEYYTRGALGLSVWDVVQIALGTMAVSCVIFGTSWLVSCEALWDSWDSRGHCASTHSRGTRREALS